MNEDTHVTVHCYEGDADQVRGAINLYTHHECPLTIVSPEDSRVVIGDLDCRFAGKRDGSVLHIQVPGEPVERIVTGGQQANMRQIEQMKLLLTMPESWFLMNDADSFCLSPQISPYLYRDDGMIWCGVANDAAADPTYREVGLPDDFPRYALQPPYFCHRSVIERMVAVGPGLPYYEKFPWIDGFMMQMAYAAKIRYQNFTDGFGADLDRYPSNLPNAIDAVKREGKVFIHSSKYASSRNPLIQARTAYVERKARDDAARAKGLKA